MKYKVIKEFPSVFRNNKIGDIISSALAIFPQCKDYPEFFEEIKEPILTTEDGVKIYKGDIYWRVFGDWEYAKQFIDQPIYGKTINFSTQEAAEKYIDENKPMYSKKQIKDALTKISNYYSDSFEIDLRVELKIN